MGWERAAVRDYPWCGSTRYPKEVRERAARLVFEHESKFPSQWAAITSIASKLGMTPVTLRKWVRRAETDEGLRPGLTSTERERMKALKKETREFRRANEILKVDVGGAARSARHPDRHRARFESAHESECRPLEGHSASFSERRSSRSPVRGVLPCPILVRGTATGEPSHHVAGGLASSRSCAAEPAAESQSGAAKRLQWRPLSAAA